MPYILSEDREKYTESLEKLLSELSKQNEDDLGGHLNYCITEILRCLFEGKRRYVRINTLRGAIENAWTEFARREVAPYEDEKIKKNGDVYKTTYSSLK